MKKTALIVAALTGVVLLASSCQSSPKFSLRGENLPEELNGKYLYIGGAGDEKASDSVQVVNGILTYTASDLDSTKLFYLLSQEIPFRVSFIKEDGDFVLQSEDGSNYVLVPVDSTAQGLNTTMQAMLSEAQTALAPIIQEFGANKMKLSQEGLAEDSIALLMEANNALNARYQETTNSIATKYYEDNKDNAIGVTAFNMFSFDDDAEFVAAYEAASEVIKSDAQMKARYETLKKSMETAEGQPYKGDFVIEDGEGNSMKLSDYMEEGKYLLVDFWASWCVPCRNAMPHLASIVKDHAKTITVLSVGVWDVKADNDAAREELGMTWNTFFDKDSKSVEEYGISGIPTLLLISPDGTIVYRGHDPQAVDAKISELGI